VGDKSTIKAVSTTLATKSTTKTLRPIADPFVVAVPTGMRIRTRLHVGEDEVEVLRRVGSHLGHLAGKDLAERCSAGNGPKHLGRKERKQRLTSESSSRLAGTITRVSDDQRQMGLDNLYRERDQLRGALYVLERRLGESVGEGVGKYKGYRSKSERWYKQQRVQVLRARLVAVESRIREGRVSVVRGGSHLMKNRHNLVAAGLSEQEWYEQWEAARFFLQADGEKDKTWGNETIRLNPDSGTLSLRLPTPLAHLSNTAGNTPTYVFATPVSFSYHADEWAAQVVGGAVSYCVSYAPENNRWYLDASWSNDSMQVPSLESLKAGRTMGVDLNYDHLACWVVTPDGNVLGAPIRIELEQKGSTGTRDGHLRAAITTLLDLAQVHSCSSITIENLNFSDARATGRETLGTGARAKSFRRTVSGMPTAKFRDRLSGMAANRGISIIAVDPAYTSAWAKEWAGPLQDQVSTRSKRSVTGHSCAAVLIARRGKGHYTQRPSSTRTTSHQRMTSGEPGLEGGYGDPGLVVPRDTRPSQGEPECPGSRARHLESPGPIRPFGRAVVEVLSTI
jgi:hypothetical protein